MIGCGNYLPWYVRVVPLTYDDSLSYYEQLLHVYKKVNQLAEIVNDLPDNILSEAKAYADGIVNGILGESKTYTDNQIKIVNENWNNAIETLNSKINREVHDLDEKIINVSDEVANIILQFADVQNELNTLNGKIENIDENIDVKINALYGQLVEYIDEHLSQLVKLYLCSNSHPFSQ